ncbi:unnamed protein product [Gordionus sp. m RMFG-2023]
MQSKAGFSQPFSYPLSFSYSFSFPQSKASHEVSLPSSSRLPPSMSPPLFRARHVFPQPPFPSLYLVLSLSLSISLSDQGNFPLPFTLCRAKQGFHPPFSFLCPPSLSFPLSLNESVPFLFPFTQAEQSKRFPFPIPFSFPSLKAM